VNDAGTFSISQDTDVPAGYGFSKSLKIDCTTADASISSGSYHRIYQRIEAQNLAPVHSGSANAKQLVYSFWIKFDNASGDFCANILNLSDSNNRVIAKKFTYGSGAGWQKYSFVIPGDTGGNALTPDNSGAYYVQIYMQAGSDLTSGTLQTTWATRENANRAVGQTLQLTSNTSNNVYFTGAQLEIGDAPSDFELLPFDVQFTRCCRYYWKPVQGNDSTNEYVGLGDFYSSTQVDTDFRHITPMRAQPSLDQGTGTNYYTYYYGNTASGTVDGAWTYWLGNEHISTIYATASDAVGTSNTGKACRIIAVGASAYIALNAEI
jgi:hypothetical protein